MRCTRAGSAKAKGAGILRVQLRQRRHEFRDRRQQGGDQRILLRRAEAGEDDAAGWLKSASEIGEGALGLGEEHDTVAREQQIGGPRLERIGRGVGLGEAHHRIAGAAFLGAVQHRLRDNDAEHPALRPDQPREVQCGGTAAAADVDRALSRFDGGADQRGIGDRLHGDVPGLLPRGPGCLASWLQYSIWLGMVRGSRG